MVFGINREYLRILFNPSLGYAYYKRNRLLKKYKDKEVSIGLFTSVKETELGHNVFLGNQVSINKSVLGDFSYVNSNSKINRAYIGKFCSIASNVVMGLGKHPTDLVSTHPSFYSNNKR